MSTRPSTTTAPRGLRLALGAALATVLAVLAALLAVPAQAATAPEDDPAWVRVAHLVPDLPTMDVWLTPFDGDTDAEATLTTSASYGRVKEYAPLPAGLYAVSMREAGAPADSPPLLNGTFEATAGQAYTVAGLEESGEARVQVLTDDLTPPPAGQARVRLLPAASDVPILSVNAVDGPALATDIAYATPSGYASVPAGTWQLDVLPAAGAGQPDTTSSVDLGAGGVYTLLVLQGDDGLDVLAVTDAQGTTVTPVGGAATGRTAPPVGGTPAGGPALTLLGLVLVGGAVLAVRTRTRLRVGLQ